MIFQEWYKVINQNKNKIKLIFNNIKFLKIKIKKTRKKLIILRTKRNIVMEKSKNKKEKQLCLSLSKSLIPQIVLKNQIKIKKNSGLDGGLTPL